MNCELRTANYEGPALGGAFDSHAHFGEDWRAVLERARAAGMAGLVAVGCDARSNAFAKSVAAAAPDFALLALGFDYSTDVSPDEAEAFLRHEENAESVPIASKPLSLCASVLKTHAECAEASVGNPCYPRHPCENIAPGAGGAAAPLRAIGEIGLDYSHEGAEPVVQRALFERQLALAAEWGLPVIVHSREAVDDTLASLRAAGSRALAAEGRLGVLHCFTGDQDFAEQVLSLGMMVSFSGIATFRNAAPLRAVAATIPDDRILVETDCPYLAPVPLRGRVNEPAFVSHTLRCLATVRGVAPERLAALTRDNALRLFAPDAL